MKKAVLDQMGLSPEDHHCPVQTIRLRSAGCPFTFAQLKDTATRWLQPGESVAEEQMLEQVGLGQLVEGLPTGDFGVGAVSYNRQWWIQFNRLVEQCVGVHSQPLGT